MKGRPTHTTRVQRARKDFWKRFGVWLFILFFALGSAGLIVVSTVLSGSGSTSR